MIEASCHCGAVRIEVDDAPRTVTDRNCSLCRRLGALWAYYPAAAVRVRGEVADYVQGGRTLAVHRCTACGCTTHWSGLGDKAARVGVNARMLEPAALAQARVRRLDGADTWQYLDGP